MTGWCGSRSPERKNAAGIFSGVKEENVVTSRSRHDQAQNVLARYGAVNAAVGAVVAIVAQDKILIHPTDPHLFAIAGTGVGRCIRGKIRFLQQLAVDVEMTFFDDHSVASFGNDAFDGVTIVGGITEDDDVPGFGIADMINEAVQDIAFGIMQGGRHARADHLNGLQDVPADEAKRAIGDRCDHEAGEDLLEEVSAEG